MEIQVRLFIIKYIKILQNVIFIKTRIGGPI